MATCAQSRGGMADMANLICCIFTKTYTFQNKYKVFKFLYLLMCRTLPIAMGVDFSIAPYTQP